VRWRGVLDDTDEMRVDERWRRKVWWDKDEDKEEQSKSRSDTMRGTSGVLVLRRLACMRRATILPHSPPG
jgi:hypothetical protein